MFDKEISTSRKNIICVNWEKSSFYGLFVTVETNYHLQVRIDAVPVAQVGKRDLSLMIDVTTDSDLHILSGAEVDMGSLARMSVQNPDGNRNAVGRSPVGMEGDL